MGGRAADNALELVNHTKPVHRLTPFFLTHGSEAVLPSDLDYGAPRVKPFNPETAAEAQRDAMEILEEARLATLHRSARYQ